MKLSVICNPLLGILAFSFACSRGPNTPIGYDPALLDAPPVEKPKPRPTHPKLPPDVVLKAAGSVRIERLSDGRELGSPELERELLAASAVCAGEEHDSAAQHYGELWLIERLARFAPNLGLEFGVGFEMFQAPFQKYLDQFQRGNIEMDRLLRESEYEDRWGYSIEYYRPLLERARQLRLPLVALNAPQELTRSIAARGLDGLDPKLERHLPSLDLYDKDHRVDFEQAMQGHPGVTPERMDNYYAAQVVWDEAMAARSAEWLAEHAPIRRLLVIAGRAHCAHSAIPTRMERRNTGPVVSVLLGTEPPTAELRARYDYSLIVGAPDDRSSAPKGESN